MGLVMPVVGEYVQASKPFLHRIEKVLRSSAVKHVGHCAGDSTLPFVANAAAISVVAAAAAVG